jgi:uncharacterized protein (TIGR03000 family)
MIRQVTKGLSAVAALAALACAGMPSAQAKEWPGPYDHAARRYYADEARDYAAMGYDVPSGYGQYNRPYYYSAPPTYYRGYPYAAPAYPLGAYAPAAPDNAAHVRVVVPADAQVWFDGNATKATGPVRRFDSPALTPGRQYTYDVKARWRGADGKEVTQTRHVDVAANADVDVDFTPHPDSAR